jgi:hypothetical protein
MNARQSHEYRCRGDDDQQDEAEVDARFGGLASDAERRASGRDVAQDPGVDYRQWRRDRHKKFSEAFDTARASRPARSSATGRHRGPPSEGTEPGQPYSAAPGASGKNK